MAYVGNINGCCTLTFVAEFLEEEPVINEEVWTLLITDGTRGRVWAEYLKARLVRQSLERTKPSMEEDAIIRNNLQKPSPS